MNFFEALQPALLNAATIILTAFISVAAGMAARFIYTKLGAEKYDRLYKFALDAWRVTDEYFRITPNVEKTIDTTFAKFKTTLLQLAPGLTDEQINNFRLAIAGAVNEGREALDPAKLSAEPAAAALTDAPDVTVPVESEPAAEDTAQKTETPTADPAPATAQPAAVEGVSASDTTDAQ